MSMVPVMGCDAHLDTVTVAVVDRVGAELETATLPNTPTGWGDTLEMCHRHGVSVVGIEGASGFGRRMAQTLTAAGIRVREVPTRLTARTRHVDGAGKTDPGDARTIARAVLNAHGHRWGDHPDYETLRVLTARREHLVRAQTAETNQLRALLIEINPERAAQLGRLRSVRSLEALTRIEATGDTHRRTVAQIITEIATGCLTRHHEIRQLTQRIEAVMPPAGKALIAEFHGCGVIVAAQILSQIAGSDGFATDAHMASWAGTAPLDVSSGRQQRHRLNPTGNRQTNRAIHTIILTQHRHHGEAAHYIQRRTTEGKTTKEAIRALKRHLTRRIWKTLHNHQLT